MSDKILITKEGYERLIAEINDLIQIQRPHVTKTISEARELGDLSENAEYHTAREKQRIIDSKLSSLQRIFTNAEIIEIANIVNKDTIRFGATVTYTNHNLERDVTVKILSEYESDPSKMYISLNTPIAKCLLGKKIGDSANLEINNTTHELEIINIQYI